MANFRPFMTIWSSDKSGRHRTSPTSLILPTLGGYALMNQNTTIEATETKMDHISVICIKKGSIWALLADFADSPFNKS